MAQRRQMAQDRQMAQRRQILYSGQVQGVGFRYTTRSIAQGYDVTGFVRNLPDGRVEVVAEGAADELDRFLDELAEQMSSCIRSVDCRGGTKGIDAKKGERRTVSGEFADFAIRY